MKKILALLLCVSFLFVLIAACGDNSNPSGGPPIETGPGPIVNPGGEGEDGEEEEGGPPTFVPPNYNLPDVEDYKRMTADGRRHIIIANWWDSFYDSSHSDIFDDPGVTDPETAQMMLDRIRYVEEKYNVYIERINMTWDGIVENIPISIMSGIPDADIYMIDLSFGIPAILNGMATALEDMGIPANHDVFARPGENIVMTSFKIPGQDKTYMFKPETIFENMYMLGYNRDLLQLYGLEDPQELWDKGEWTWDTFREHCRTLTDHSQDIYGYGGYWTNFVQQMLFSNDAAFASGPIQSVDSPKTLEVLNFVHELYNVDRTARPWNPDDWVINNRVHMEGKTGFWITAQWISSSDGEGTVDATFEFGMVPFPVGPQGNQETMATSPISGNWYMIPRYIKDADEVFNVFYDLINWWDFDIEYRDDMDWLRDRFGPDINYDFYMKTVGRFGFDLFDKLGFGPSVDSIMDSTTGPALYTPAQYAEIYRQVYQDALDNYFG